MLSVCLRVPLQGTERFINTVMADFNEVIRRRAAQFRYEEAMMADPDVEHRIIGGEDGQS